MFKLLFKFIKPYRKEFIISVVTIVIESLLEISCPYLMSMLLEYGIIQNGDTYIIDNEVVILLSCLMVLFGTLAFISGLFFAKYVARFSKGVGYEIRKAEYLKLKEYSFHNLDSVSASSLLTRLTSDINIIADTVSNSFRPMFRAPVMLIATLTISAITSPILSCVFFVTVPILAIIMVVIVKYVKPRFLKIQKIVDRMNRNTKESIVAIKTIKSYVKEDFEINKFKEINDDSRKSSNDAMGANGLMMPAQELVLYSTIVGILYLGGYLALKPDYANIVVNIAMFLTYVTQLLATVQMLTNVTLNLNRAGASVTRVEELFKVKSEIKDNPSSKLQVLNGDIEFKNVSFSYFNDKNYVLNNVSLKIKSGSFVGVVGQTGSSKTTLINLLLRFYDVSEGNVFIGDHDVRDYSIHELRKNISISFQNPFLFNDTVLNNIKRGNKEATMDEVINAAKIACAYDFITNDLEDGFNTMIAEGGTNLSGGQRQRVCLARAILMHPKVLILDDSFSALDRITEAKVKENLKNTLPDVTKIVISQKISTIKDSDEIIVLEKGNVSNIGNHNFLAENDPIYKDINNIQNEGLE